MTEKSYMFISIEDGLKAAGKEEIIDTAICALGDFIREMSEAEDGVKFGLMILGAKLGLAADGNLSSLQKEIIDKVFIPVSDGDMDGIYEMITVKTTQEDYEKLEAVKQFGAPVAVPFLLYTLSFAYIDGECDDITAAHLDAVLAELMDF